MGWLGEQQGRVGVLSAHRPARAPRPRGPRGAGQPVRPHGPDVTRWLDHPKRARWHLHFTPTSSSWLNLVEGWFKQLTERRLRRGVFTSVSDLIEAIELWAEHWNDKPQPFVWHTPAAEIINKVKRGRATLHQVKSATHH